MVVAAGASDVPMRIWAFSLVLLGLAMQAQAQEGAAALDASAEADVVEADAAEADAAEADAAEADAAEADAAEAEAEPDASTDALAIEVHIGTTAPLDVFVGANVVLAERLVLTTSIGVSVYRGTIDSVAERVGAEESARVVSPLLFGATLVRLGVGLRPFGNGGPEVLAGYARIMGSATWEAGSFGVPARFGEISASVAIHAVYAELGWPIRIGHAFVRPAIGFTRALGARVKASAEEANATQSEVASERAGEAVDEALDEFRMTPTVSLSIGGRFSFR